MECLQEVCKILIRRHGINHMDPAFTEVCFILAFIAAMWVFTMIFLWCEQRRNNALRQNNLELVTLKFDKKIFLILLHP